MSKQLERLGKLMLDTAVFLRNMQPKNNFTYVYQQIFDACADMNHSGFGAAPSRDDRRFYDVLMELTVLLLELRDADTVKAIRSITKRHIGSIKWDDYIDSQEEGEVPIYLSLGGVWQSRLRNVATQSRNKMTIAIATTLANNKSFIEFFNELQKI